MPDGSCLVLIRTQLFDDADRPSVAALQDRVGVRTLSAYQGRPAPAASPLPAHVPAADIRRRPGFDFLRALDWMLRLMPVLPGEEGLRRELAAVGAGDGAIPEEPAERAEVLAGLAAGEQDMLARAGATRSSAELFGSRGFFAGDYLAKAAGAYLGILGNAAEEYLGVGYRFDREGRPFDGSSAYRIHFPAGGLPPVGAFWSITVYDADRHLYANDLHRYARSSRDLPAMRRDPDGGVTVLVQHRPPPDDVLPNWLPCPRGPFGLTFRTYLPGPEVRDGSWTAPPVQRVEEVAAA